MGRGKVRLGAGWVDIVVAIVEAVDVDGVEVSG